MERVCHDGEASPMWSASRSYVLTHKDGQDEHTRAAENCVEGVHFNPIHRRERVGRVDDAASEKKPEELSACKGSQQTCDASLKQ